VPWRKGPELLYVGPKQFAEELAYKRHHYQAITLREVYDAWTGQGSLPKHPIVISFDDGYVDQVRIAAPILRRYGWPAELALIFSTLYRGASAPPTRLTTAMVRRLLERGWGLESHAVSPPDLTRLSTADLRYELEYSRTRLQETFGVPIDLLCYPGGISDARVRRAARRAGYLAATGTKFAAATPAQLYALPRIYCYWDESLSVFAKRLRVTLAAARVTGND
jgi:peptidoglycan/xylan/chitin deacetylase (PgdA/CDA1 family)